MSAALRLQRVSVALDGRPVLEDVSLEVARGEFCCLCGPNGGGKTTLLHTISGSLRPRSGCIFFDGKPITRLSAPEIVLDDLGELAASIGLSQRPVTT